MKHNKSQQDELMKLSDEEISYLLKLRKNPILFNNLESLLQRFEQEIAQGMDVNQVELNAIESVQKLDK